MYKVLPLFRSHHSLGRSILTLEKPTAPEKTPSYPISIFDLLIRNKLDTLVLVEDNLSGLLKASKNCKENKINLIFGLRLELTEDSLKQDEESLKKRAKYIIFARDSKGYDALLKISSFAATKGFYYNPTIDFKNLKKLWSEHLMLAIPFYDSFLHLNAFHSHQHVPLIQEYNPVFLLEDNDLPFDEFLRDKVVNYCKINNYETLPAQSIFYKTTEDFLAYIAFRCVHNKGGHSKSTLDRPELDHMGSNTFSFDRWLKINS